MNIRWVQAPCLNCSNRQVGCHSSCEKYKDYKTRHYAEKDRMDAEDRLNNTINQLNYGSALKERDKQPEPLKHGRKKKRRQI